jgi:quinoprotein glucose dehydrogenase
MALVGEREERPSRHWLGIVLFALVGAWLFKGGLDLVSLGGSPYYLLAGIALVSCAALLVLRRRAAGFALYAGFLLATLFWSLWEVGFDGWGLFSRLFAPSLLGAILALPWLWRRLGKAKLTGLTVAALFAAGIALASDGPSYPDGPIAAYTGPAPDWNTYAGELRGTRFSPIDQITPTNVGRLEHAWTYRTGDLPGPDDALSAWTFEATPLQVGDRLFVCTTHSEVHAIDADTGKRVWMHDPASKLDWTPLRACRGVAYYAEEKTGGEAERPCTRRVISPTLDGRLIALDAASGARCSDFGTNGELDLKRDLGTIRPGYYFVTSAPIVVDGRVIVGAFVMDGAEIGEPSGVIRAFNAGTGRLEWSWDLAADEGLAPASAAKGRYTRGTPNAWAPISADPELGLVYIPLGNATPDFFGAHRSPAMERYGSALVALDAATGTERWSFQTVHHDIWDQDLPAQPSLFELPGKNGPMPALVLPTKAGQLFVLDRRTGQPLRTVEERSVPQGAVPGDFTSPTQPFSAGMPSLLRDRFTEASAWGMTPIDQMMCRIRFRRLRYEGPFTPPSVQTSLSYPGSSGIVSWGGVTIDPVRNMLIANSGHMPFTTRLIPRAEADAIGLSRPPNSLDASTNAKGSAERASGAMAGLPQVGTPYAAQAVPFISPLGVPCIAPPWGQLTGVDLNTGKIAWQNPLGTARDTGPLGMQTGLPLPIGVPNTGGSIAIGSGVTFIGAAQDRYLRAYATQTGEELWRSRLPAGGQATPLTYFSKQTGKQFVVIAAGGHQGLGTGLGDYVVAYRLP